MLNGVFAGYPPVLGYYAAFMLDFKPGLLALGMISCTPATNFFGTLLTNYKIADNPMAATAQTSLN